MPRWLALAARCDVVRRSTKVALIVGTVLVIINHGDHLLAGGVTSGGWVKIALTYVVPYCVSTYASVAAVLLAR